MGTSSHLGGYFGTEPNATARSGQITEQEREGLQTQAYLTSGTKLFYKEAISLRGLAKIVSHYLLTTARVLAQPTANPVINMQLAPTSYESEFFFLLLLFFFAVVRRFNSHACNPLGKSCMTIRRCRQRHLDVYTILKGKNKNN